MSIYSPIANLTDDNAETDLGSEMHQKQMIMQKLIWNQRCTKIFPYNLTIIKAPYHFMYW
jgi:hypothetical protein